MISLLPATSETLCKMRGELPSKTVRAIAVLNGDVVLGIGGFYLDKDKAVMFADISDSLRKHPVALLKAAMTVLRWLKKLRIPVYASCDENIEAASRFLTHLGFTHVDKDIWLLQSR